MTERPHDQSGEPGTGNLSADGGCFSWYDSREDPTGEQAREDDRGADILAAIIAAAQQGRTARARARGRR